MQKDLTEGHWSLLGLGEEKMSGMERKLANWKENGTQMLGHFEERRYQCVQPRNLEEERRTIYDSLYCGIFEH